jgi:hypothetical protein
MHGLGDDKIAELVTRTQDWDWDAKEAVALAWIHDAFKLAKAMGFTVHYGADHDSHAELHTGLVTVLEPEED